MVAGSRGRRGVVALSPPTFRWHMRQIEIFRVCVCVSHEDCETSILLRRFCSYFVKVSRFLTSLGAINALRNLWTNCAVVMKVILPTVLYPESTPLRSSRKHLQDKHAMLSYWNTGATIQWNNPVTCDRYKYPWKKITLVGLFIKIKSQFANERRKYACCFLILYCTGVLHVTY